MEATGERLIPTQRGKNTWEHLHRYYLATKYSQDRHVLDIASGEGYGARIISSVASTVVGIDISQEAVSHATATYKSSNLSYKVGTCLCIPLPDQSVDLVVSFETIEHIEEHHLFLAEIKRVLRKDGMLIISTPNKKIYSDLATFSNPFHLKELYIEEFKSLLDSQFNKVFFLYQSVLEGSMILPEDSKGLHPTMWSGNFGKFAESNFNQNAEYVIAFCSQFELPEFNTSTFSWRDDESCQGPEERKSFTNRLISKIWRIFK